MRDKTGRSRVASLLLWLGYSSGISTFQPGVSRQQCGYETPASRGEGRGTYHVAARPLMRTCVISDPGMERHQVITVPTCSIRCVSLCTEHEVPEICENPRHSGANNACEKQMPCYLLIQALEIERVAGRGTIQGENPSEGSHW